MTSKILITGGLGYVGGRISTALAQAGYEIRCGTRRANECPPSWLPQMRMANLDWNSEQSLKKACENVDCVIHLSGMNEMESLRDPIGALMVNGVASLRLLEAAKLSGVSRFLYFSTAHIYGSPLEGKITEETIPKPLHPYAISHRVAEDFVLAAHEQKQIEGVVIRLSNSFGAPITPDIDRWSLLVNDLCRQAITDGELKLRGDGSQYRDFITLEDVARATIHLLKLDFSKLDDGLFNLGSGRSHTVLHMSKLVASRWTKMTGRGIEIKYLPDEGVSIPVLSYDCGKIARAGYIPTSNYEKEIDKTLELCIDTFS